MSEVLQAAPEGEAPINPYSLLDAVNDASDTVHTGWLIFLGVMAYLLVAVAGIGHRDLLLNNDIPLPVLQVKIELTRFFLFAPILLVLFHIGILMQLVLLARKTIEFDTALSMLETTEKRTHPLRLQLHNFFFVQAIAGPERSPIMGLLLNGMSWLTLVVLPVLVLLFIQIVFLPYHSEAITWAHRIALSLDVAMLGLVGVFLLRADQSFFSAVVRIVRRHPFSFLATGLLMLVVGFVSFVVATIPGERISRLTDRMLGGSGTQLTANSEAGQIIGYVLPFFGAREDQSLFGLFHRNLVAKDLKRGDTDKEDAAAGTDRPVNLRERDLRRAMLDRADLRNADLTGAKLDGASLMGADLRGAVLGCSDPDALLLRQDARTAKCTSGIGASFKKARLAGARISNVDLSGAILEDADLEGAELRNVSLVGAPMGGVILDRADLTDGTQLTGADLAGARLQGANLRFVRLEGANLASATLKAARLSGARLHGASLADADLEGADLRDALLHGAELTGALLRAADLRGTSIWLTSVPPTERLRLADLEKVELSLPNGELADVVKRAIARVDTALAPTTVDPRTRDIAKRQIRDRLERLVEPGQGGRWQQGPDLAGWRLAVATPLGETYKAQITAFLLNDMACRKRFGSGAVASGVARRAADDGFRGDRLQVLAGLQQASCTPATRVSRDIMKALEENADEDRAKP